MSQVIAAQQISHQFEQEWVLDKIDFSLNQGEIITLIGPNGAGKSTLLRILLGLLTPTQGKVLRAPNLKIGFMPQKVHLEATLPMSVENFLQLALPAPPNRWRFWQSYHQDFNHEQRQIIDELDLERLLQHPIQKVSGGEMQRILLARALMRDPTLLVLDEPVQGVDIQGQNELYEYINYVRQQRQCAVLMVSHDLHIVMKHTDQVLCLNRHICCSGHPTNVQQSHVYRDLFGISENAIAVYEHHHDHDTCDHTHGEGHIHLHDTHPTQKD